MRYLEANLAATIKKLAVRLGRTEASITQKRHELGIGKERRWSVPDTEFLRANTRMPVKEVARRLGKSEASVHAKRGAMGIRSHDWTPDEDKLVRMWHNRAPAAEIAAKLPGRTATAVATRARQLGLRSDAFWEDGEEYFLKSNPDMGAAEAARVLGKSLHAVHHKRRGLGLTRKQKHREWTDDDKAVLSELTQHHTAESIADKMGRTKPSIQCMQRIMGLGTPRSLKALQPSEEKFLRDHPDMPAVEIAKHMKRTPASVRRWRNKLGLPRYHDYKPWTEDETKTLLDNLRRPLSEIYALFPDRPKPSVSAKAQSLGRKRLRRKGHTYRSGYEQTWQRDGKTVLAHRAAAAEKIGRPLMDAEVVHHINYVRHDNRPSNLDVLADSSAHAGMQAQVNGLIDALLSAGAVGYDRGAHAYFLPSRSFEPASDGARVSPGKTPATSYVFCGDRIFPFSPRPDESLANTLSELPSADPAGMEGRHAVVLCGAAASPALLERGLGPGASPFPVVKGVVANHDVAHVDAAIAGRFVRDALIPSPGASAAVWVALLDSRQLGALDACAGRGNLCDLVEIPDGVVFESGDALSAAHAYAPRAGSAAAPGTRVVSGSPPPLSRVFAPRIHSRSGRRAD